MSTGLGPIAVHPAQPANLVVLLPTVLTDWWGFFYWLPSPIVSTPIVSTLIDKAAVFLDYENVHGTAHNLFAAVGEPMYDTVINPLQLADRLVAKRKNGGVLTSVRVFRGRPVPAYQPKPASANDVQTVAWESDQRVSVFRRDLKYNMGADGSFTAREKGIDVSLAISLVEGALDRDFDVAILFSGDTDLAPALELVFRRRLVRREIAAWAGSKPLWFPEFMRQTPPLRLPYCHFLNAEDFLQVRDFSQPPPHRDR